MRRPSVDEQIEEVKQLSANSSLQGYLAVHRAILEARQEIESTVGKGTNLNLADEQTIVGLEHQALPSRQAILSMLDALTFDPHAITGMCNSLLTALLRQDVKDKLQLKRLQNLLSDERLDFTELLMDALRNDYDSLKLYSKKAKVGWRTLYTVAALLIQPLAEEIARRVSESFLENWQRGNCPVCGRPPTVARIRLESRRRYLTCVLCGAAYMVDYFFCPHCGNRDPTSLKFLALQDSPAFRIDFCEKCRRYTKVIDENRARAPVPRGLEDILTVELDQLARRAKLRP